MNFVLNQDRIIHQWTLVLRIMNFDIAT